jgi:hypothetical protein
MKTTIEMPDALLAEARRLATREGRTLRDVLEESLRDLLARRSRKGEFRLRSATFKGQGLQPPFVDADWEQIRDKAYEGRGT